jgi:hypothetical protein
MHLALEHCDPQSEYVRVAKEVIAYSQKSNGWEETLDFIQRTYPYSCYGGICPIIPNMAVMVMAMAHGKQDFRETLLICVNAGYDTDCNVGNVGSIMGALVGIDGLFAPWVNKINDVVLSSGLLGSINSLDATQQTLYFGKLANSLNPNLIDDRLASVNDFSFGLPYSTHGFYGRWHHKFDGTHINVAMDDATFRRALQINVHSALKQESLEFIKKTYFRASEVYDSRYEPSLAPVIWPGQMVSTRLKAECDGLFMAYLLVRDIDGKTAMSEDLVLTSDFVDFEIRIPPDFSLVAEVGVALVCLDRTFLTHIWMDAMMIKGSAEFDWDVTKLPMEDFGLTFYMGNHREIAGCTHVNGDWVVDGGITCQSDERSMLLFGDVRWKNANYSINLEHWHQGCAVCFAVQGARRYIEIVRINQTKFHISKNENGNVSNLSEVIISHVKSEQISLHIEYVSHIIIFKVSGLTVGKIFIKDGFAAGGLGFISEHKNSIFITGIRVSKADFNINEEET